MVHRTERTQRENRMREGQVVTFTAEQAAAAYTALRTARRQPPPRFSLVALVGLISEEIEQLRQLAFSDEEIAELVSHSTRVEIGADAIRRYYAPSELRRPLG